MRIQLALTLLALVSLPALAAPRGDELLLRKRQVDVLIDENLARVTLTWKVSNPCLRPLEGDVVFKAPKGAVVTNATLLKHIASSDREATLLPCPRASALYESVKSHDLKDAELQEVFQLIGAAGGARAGAAPPALTNPAPRTPNPPPPPSTRTAPPTQGEINQKLAAAGVQQSTAHLLVTPSGNPMHPLRIHNPNNPSQFVDDPALVEWLGDDTYRLRFFPVPPNDDQTISVTMVVEANADGADRFLRVPLAFKDNYVEGAKTEYEARLDVRSEKPFDFLGSTSHAFRVQNGTASVLEDKPANELAFRYRLAPNAGLKAPPDAPGVSPRDSLLVIAGSDRKQAERRGGIPQAAGPKAEDLVKCGFVRAGASECCEHSVVTTDSARLTWARGRGLSPRPRQGKIGFANTGVYEFDYVAHTAGCPISEVDPAKLKALAAALK